jgi:hypothetical protein
MTEPFNDTELPCSHFIRLTRIRDGSGGSGEERASGIDYRVTGLPAPRLDSVPSAGILGP